MTAGRWALARRKFSEMGTMPSDTADQAVVFDVRGLDYVSVACFSRNGSWNASLVVTLEVSPDGDQWYTAQWFDPGAVGSASNVTTYTANGIRRYVNVFDVGYIRARVSTLGGATTIVVNCYGEGEWEPDKNTRNTTGVVGGFTSVGAGGSTGGGSSGGGGGFGPGGGVGPPSSGGGIGGVSSL